MATYIAEIKRGTEDCVHRFLHSPTLPLPNVRRQRYEALIFHFTILRDTNFMAWSDCVCRINFL